LRRGTRIGKPEGNGPVGKPRWMDSIRIDLGEMRWGDVDWIGLAHYMDRWKALVNEVMNLRIP
jgi:hypothetical protein